VLPAADRHGFALRSELGFRWGSWGGDRPPEEIRGAVYCPGSITLRSFRSLQPADVAALAKFLLSAESDWMTGQVFGVDGGMSTLRT
jgi:NAD(P)-dependent dehydrogenase (short-subunit alcohol dehydrogenase family)